MIKILLLSVLWSYWIGDYSVMVYHWNTILWYEFSDVVYQHKLGKFVSVPTSFELQAANLQESIGEAQDTLMNTNPTQSVINACETFGKFVKFTVEIFCSNFMI